MKLNSFKNNIPILSMLVIFIIDLILILTTHLNWNSAMSKYLPLKSHIQTFKSDISTGHLWFEEAISGDVFINIETDVMIKFKQEKFKNFVRNEKKQLSTSEDKILYKLLEELVFGVDNFYVISQERWKDSFLHKVGSALDQKFDLEFNKLIKIADDFNSLIDKRLAEEFDNRNRYFEYILILFFILNFSIFIILFITRKDKIKFENELYNQKKKAEITLSSIGDAVITTDEKGFIEFLNPIAEKLTGYQSLEAKGKYLDDVFNIFNSSTKKKIESPVKKVLEKGIIVGLANGTALNSKSGDIYIIEDSAAPIKDLDGNILGTILVFHDVTEQIKTREQLHLNEKMLIQQSKLASMGEMLENIAHQWRQPLSAITTAASGMKIEKEYNILKDESFNKNLEAILSNSNNLSKTLDDFRDFFKPSGEKVLLKLKDIVINALSIVSSKIELNNIKLITKYEDVEIRGFSSELLQIFVTFFNNSIQAFDDSSNNKMIFIKMKKEKDNVLIIVKDNAGGVSEEVLARLFEPYFTTKHKSQGKGIGLFMVEEMLTKHMDAEISVNNKTFEYEGSDFKGLEFIIKLKS